MRQALSDLRVVEIGTGVAAGWCGKVFADLGADVVKVEPPDGDPLRADAGMFAHLHTNKRSAVIEVAPAAVASLSELLDGVDLVIEAPGFRSLADWGIDRDDLLADRRALTVVAITGFGATGPYAGYAWSDLVAQAFSGAVVLDRRGPLKLPMSLGETAVGHTAALGALAAVLRARATGVGALVDCSAVEALASAPFTDLALSRLGVPGPPGDVADDAHEQRHVAAARRLPLRRRLRGDDDDDPAARRDADGARERGAPGRLRAPGRVPAARDEGDPRRRPLSLAARSDPRRGHGRGAGGGMAGLSGQRARRAARGGPSPPAWVLGARRRPGAGPIAASGCAVPAHRRRLEATAYRAAPRPARRTEHDGRRRPNRGAALRGIRSFRAAAPRHPRARPHHGVVGPLPHRAPRRPRRRGDPSRDAARVPAVDEGLRPPSRDRHGARRARPVVRAAGTRS